MSNKSVSHIKPEDKTLYIVRQVVCLASFGIHASLFGQSDSILLWTTLFIFVGVYPIALLYIPILKDNAKRNLRIDTVLDGLFLGLWGFNPYLIAIYTAGSNVIKITTGGIAYAFRGLGLMFLASLAGGAIQGFQYRGELPTSTLIIASAGLLVFVTLFGIKAYKVNSRLRSTRTRLQHQKEELIHLNKLALLVNSHLDINVIMESVMRTIEETYPFEAMYIISFQDDNQKLEVSGIYGSSVSQVEYLHFQGMHFDLHADQESIFIQGLINKKVIYMPNITPEMAIQGCEIDRKLFSIKQCLSLAYFPVFVDDQVIAGACFINYEKTFQLKPHDINKIQEYLVQVGTAVRNATLFDQLTKAKEQAMKAQTKAEASEEAKSRFLANMSHEIRTPLTAIMGYSEALQENNLSKQDQENFISYILRGGKHLLSMINDILDISKIEASKIDIEKIDCNIFEILCDIESYMAIKTQDKGLKFSINIEYPIPRILNSDPTRLRQVLLNLCNNAEKFTEQGKIALSVKSTDNKALEIRISDTGIGINASDQDLIFNAFDQADTSITRLFGGTGLGLYISRNLARLLGGDIQVESIKDVGSTFIFSIPITLPLSEKNTLIETKEQYQQQMIDMKKSKIFDSIPSLSGRVLIAEDNIDNQNIISRLVKQTGMQVDIVENGFQAYEAAKKHQYSLILLDMQMPIMCGKEAIRRLNITGVTTPIVACTANVMKHQIEEYESLGFSDVLEKPIIKDKLFKTLTSLTQKSGNKRCAKVLIVEDNEVNQMILSRYVTKSNEFAEVVLASNGQEAVEHAKRADFDLILMDMEMPIMNGLEATKKIRGLGCKMPIYMVSGNIDKMNINLCMDAGASGHLAKPLDKNKVIGIIKMTIC